MQSHEGLVKYQTCLIFCRSTVTARKLQLILTDYLNIALGPSKIPRQVSSSGTPPLIGLICGKWEFHMNLNFRKCPPPPPPPPQVEVCGLRMLSSYDLLMLHMIPFRSKLVFLLHLLFCQLPNLVCVSWFSSGTETIVSGV